jgi:hypothetical protein
LSSRIPYLELYAPVVKLNGPDFEVNPYGSDETGREGVIRKPKEQATLSHTTIPNQEQLDEFIIICSTSCSSSCCCHLTLFFSPNRKTPVAAAISSADSQRACLPALHTET